MSAAVVRFTYVPLKKFLYVSNVIFAGMSCKLNIIYVCLFVCLFVLKGTLYSAANDPRPQIDPQTANDPQIGPQMIPDVTANVTVHGKTYFGAYPLDGRNR